MKIETTVVGGSFALEFIFAMQMLEALFKRYNQALPDITVNDTTVCLLEQELGDYLQVDASSEPRPMDCAFRISGLKVIAKPHDERVQ